MPADAPLQILHVDDSLLVLHKPPGLLCVPGRGADKQDCLSRRAQAAYPDALVVHRLDMATSGLVLMARGPAMQRALGQCFERREVGKRYIALVDGWPGTEPAADDWHLIDLPIAADWHLIDLPIAADWPRRPLRVIDAAGKPSRTRWRCLAWDEASGGMRVELEPLTGRTHQLRVHLQALGHPILGDALYAPPTVQARAARLMLHAAALQLVHPATGVPMSFHCPPDF